MTVARSKQDSQKAFKKRFLTYFRDLPVQKLAAASIGKDEDTISRWKKEDADFADQIGVAKAEWAMEQVKHVRSREWLLERVLNEHFPRKMEVEDVRSNRLSRELLDRWKVIDD